MVVLQLLSLLLFHYFTWHHIQHNPMHMYSESEVSPHGFNTGLLQSKRACSLGVLEWHPFLTSSQHKWKSFHICNDGMLILKASSPMAALQSPTEQLQMVRGPLLVDASVVGGTLPMRAPSERLEPVPALHLHLLLVATNAIASAICVCVCVFKGYGVWITEWFHFPLEAAARSTNDRN